MMMIKTKATLILNTKENAEIKNAGNVLNQILDYMNEIDAEHLYSNACGIALLGSEIEKIRLYLSVISEGDLEIE